MTNLPVAREGRQTSIVLTPPKFQVGQRVTDLVNESGVIIGISYIFQRSCYDWEEGWVYQIQFDSPRKFWDSLPESIIETWQVEPCMD